MGYANLKEGDYVRLTGTDWYSNRGRIVQVEEIRGEQAYNHTVPGIGSLTSDLGHWYEGGYEAVRVSGPDAPVEEVTDAQIEAFKTAWQEADNLGLTGQRTRAGLIAVFRLDAVE